LYPHFLELVQVLVHPPGEVAHVRPAEPPAQPPALADQALHAREIVVAGEGT
jgi:hypothetical protein